MDRNRSPQSRSPQAPIETHIDYAFYKTKAARLRAEATRQAVAQVFAGTRRIGASLVRTVVRLARAIVRRPLDPGRREAQAAPGRRM